MTLNLFVVLEGQEIDQWLQKLGLDDGRLVLGMNRDVANACSSGKDEGKVSGLK